MDMSQVEGTMCMKAQGSKRQQLVRKKEKKVETQHEKQEFELHEIKLEKDV